MSQSRITVPRALKDEVCDRLRSLVPTWPLGDPMDDATRLGPVATPAQ